MSKTLVIGNWKMNKNIIESINFADNILKFPVPSSVEVICCPPSLYTYPLLQKFEASGYKIGVQNIYWQENGAYTGEISASMLLDLGVKYSLVGHSERRKYFGEDDQTVNKKVVNLFSKDLCPIICVGETAYERRADNTELVIKRQVEKALEGLDIPEKVRIVFAYEPIWAIGTGAPSTALDAQKVACFIKNLVSKIFPHNECGVLYGGSVTRENIKSYIAQDSIDGALVGGACLDPVQFSSIIKAAANDL